jgi:hypothetical protein
MIHGEIMEKSAGNGKGGVRQAGRGQNIFGGREGKFCIKPPA